MTVWKRAVKYFCMKMHELFIAMKKLLLAIALTGLIATISCNQENDAEWLIPADEVLSGGPSKDGIPSVDNPVFGTTQEIGFLDDDDLILGIKIGNTVKAYPHPILDWHEIINDEVAGHHIAIIYCPLTGTGIGWDRRINGQLTTFGVSGLLYNSNIIPYDRATDSNWSQMLLQSVNGNLMGSPAGTYTLLETSWKTWKALFPDSEVVTDATGFDRDYRSYPYGSYQTDSSLLFPVSESDDRRHRKDRVLGVILDEGAKLYTFDDFVQPAVVTDQFAGRDLLIAGSKEDNYIVAFEQSFPGLSFQPFSSPGDHSIIMTDDEGNQWNIFGEAVVGPRAGERLQPVPSFMGYFFSWAAFYPGVPINGE